MKSGVLRTPRSTGLSTASRLRTKAAPVSCFGRAGESCQGHAMRNACPFLPVPGCACTAFATLGCEWWGSPARSSCRTSMTTSCSAQAKIDLRRSSTSFDIRPVSTLQRHSIIEDAAPSGSEMLQLPRRSSTNITIAGRKKRVNALAAMRPPSMLTANGTRKISSSFLS